MKDYFDLSEFNEWYRNEINIDELDNNIDDEVDEITRNMIEYEAVLKCERAAKNKKREPHRNYFNPPTFWKHISNLEKNSK